MPSLLAFVCAAIVSGALIVWRGEPGAPVWSVGLGAMGAGFLASVVVVMREGLVEDLVKSVVFTVIGGVLLIQGVPPWMAWPLVVGPWAGLVVNRATGRNPSGGDARPTEQESTETRRG